jgi:murein L,D-transpeptidase YcbB/YkuD
MPFASAKSVTIRSAAAASIASLGLALAAFMPAPSTTSVSAQSAAPAAPQLGRWSADAVRALLAEIEASAGEGLDPGDYPARELSAALAAGPAGGAALDQLAEAAALKLARDYLVGRIEEKRRFDWHIERTDADEGQLAAQLRAAVADGRVQPWLRSLLPGDPRYAGLRQALAETPEENIILRGRLRANLERWRWLPRDLGADHIFVNVPSYTLQLVEDGRTVDNFTVVVGARATPTPAISYPAKAVVLNPWWTPPKSIKVSGKGFVNSGGVLRQPPGPRNALGRVKIDMQNPHAIYLHDTPAKAYFEKPSRAYSHGCIRVQDVDRLAAELVRLDGGPQSAVENGLRSSRTQTVGLKTGRPVWLVYFTADIGEDGKLRLLEDPYGRDSRVLASLDRGLQLASR